MADSTKNSLRSIKNESLKLDENERKGVEKLLDMLLTLRQQKVLRNSFEKEKEWNKEQ